MRTRGLYFAEDFLCAGSSALLLAVSRVYGEFWYIALIALVPFLWLARQTGFLRSLRRGAMLTVAYGPVVLPHEISLVPWTFLVELGTMAAVLAAYSVLLNRIGRFLGSNVILMALAWLPLECVLRYVGIFNGLGALLPAESPLVQRTCYLLGALFISFVIVLINSVILTLFGLLVRLNPSGLHPRNIDRKPTTIPEYQCVVGNADYILPNMRAPPPDVILYYS